MKRVILLILVFHLLSIACFAQLSIHIFGGFPFNWEDGYLLGEETTTKVTSISFGFGTSFPRSERFSYCFFDEIIFPQSLDITIGGVTSSADRNDYDTLMGMSVFLGTVFKLYISAQGKLIIPLTAGIRWMWLMANTTYVNVFGNNIGVGAGPGIEYHLNAKVYFFGRVMFYYDFFSFSIITTGYGSSSNSGLISSFSITPNIGIGLRF